MPELPEVQTTVNGLKQTVVGSKIVDVWSDYNSPYFKGTDTIKDPVYFKYFKKEVLDKKVFSVSRRAKNILIHLDAVGGKDASGEKSSHDGEKDNSGDTILVHMKMTGHLLFGRYKYDDKNPKKPWVPISPQSLKDPYNRHIHFVLTFSNGKRLALSDSRKFAKVTLIKNNNLDKTTHLKDLGPEPLERSFSFDKFRDRMAERPNGKIKQVLTDQKIIAGIGNIYADESLWRAGIHPLERVNKISSKKLQDLFKAIKKLLEHGIALGGDSMSDYRNIHGEKGRFQERHYAYQKTGAKCSRSGCGGIISRIVIGSRSAHFCDKHQVLGRSDN